MQEEKAAKKNNTPVMVIALALVLILAGVALIVTGNNKSFLSKGEKPNEPKTEDPVEDDDPNRGIVPSELTLEEVSQLIIDKKSLEFSDETWNLGTVTIVGHDEKNEKYLVTYEEISQEGTIEVKQTIVSVLNDEKSVELPGWVEGERDLTIYNFIMNEEEPVEPVDPELPVDGEPVVIDEPPSGDTSLIEEPISIDDEDEDDDEEEIIIIEDNENE